MLREMVLNPKIHEIPRHITVGPEGSMVMTREEMNNRIDRIFNTVTTEIKKDES